MTLTYLHLSYPDDCSNKMQIYLPPSPLLPFTSCTRTQGQRCNLIRMRKKARVGTPVNHDVNVNKCVLDCIHLAIHAT